MSWVAFLAIGPLLSWINMDMEKPRAYVEHPEHGTKMIYLDEREEYLANGWNRPGQKPVEDQVFKDVEKAKETMENVEVPEEVGKKLEDMTKDELNDFAAVHTPGIKITSRMSLGAIRGKIKKALDDNSD